MLVPVQIVVYGKAQPAGSKTAYPLKNKVTGKWLRDRTGRPVINVVDANPEAKPWKARVAQVAGEQYDQPVFTGPVRLTCLFYEPRIAGHYGTGKNAHLLKDSAPLYPAKKPDVLKLARAVEDALTGVVYADDALVIEGRQKKLYCGRDEQARVVIKVEPMDFATVGQKAAAAQEELALPV